MHVAVRCSPACVWDLVVSLGRRGQGVPKQVAPFDVQNSVGLAVETRADEKGKARVEPRLFL